MGNFFALLKYKLKSKFINKKQAPKKNPKLLHEQKTFPFSTKHTPKTDGNLSLCLVNK